MTKKRIDSILIWGHGLEFLYEILDEIRKNFLILKIKRYKIKNMKKFVKDMYSFDYAPYWHLKDKTKYLLDTKNEVCFIFIENNYPDEDFFGEGAFRHKESKKLKLFKEKIRDKFNPYENNKRTHNHIIHATDSIIQTDYILKYLGYKEGVSLFDKKISFIDIPYYLDFKSFTIKNIDISQLYASIIEGENWNNFEVIIKPLKETPHFLGLMDLKIYEKYIHRFLGGPLQDDYNIKRYFKLKENFQYLKESFENSFIIVKKIDNKYIILDGLHRASLCLFNEYKEIKVCQVD